jgi:hypothetical protein
MFPLANSENIGELPQNRKLVFLTITTSAGTPTIEAAAPAAEAMPSLAAKDGGLPGSDAR